MFRFANRIPLLFEPGSDVVTKQALDMDWGRYKIDKGTAKVGIFVSVVSTRIPFRGTGKEHIAEDVKELADEVRLRCLHARPAARPACRRRSCVLRRGRCVLRAAGAQSAAAMRAAALEEAGEAAGAFRPARAVAAACASAACAHAAPAHTRPWLLSAQLAKQRKARKKALTRYIPDAARAVYAVLAKARACCAACPLLSLQAQRLTS